MTAEAKRLLDDALSLPNQERLRLAEALFDSVSSEDQAEIDEAWRTEVLRRVEQVRAGEVELESWDTVRQAGREALARR